MPIEQPEESPDATEKKWRFRKTNEPQPEPTVEPVKAPLIDTDDEPVEEPSKESRLDLNDDTPTIVSDTEEDTKILVEEAEEFTEDIIREEMGERLPHKSASSTLEIEQVKLEEQVVSKQAEDLLQEIKEINTKNKALSEELATLTEQLDQANSNNVEREKQITELEAELARIIDNEKEKTKKLKKAEQNLSKADDKIRKLEENYKLQEKTAKEREEHLLTQLEAMAEQIGKLREVLRKRDDELVTLQKDILTKKDLAQDAQEEASQLRTVGIVQREAVQDTTVLRRRLTDLEVELEKLNKVLDKDPKYRIYLLVRETGQRTLEELSKVLGVGIYEARRRVQELVRAGLLELKNETVILARHIK